MQVSYTEASIDSNRSTEALDLIITTCTSTISATELTEENEWPSFYTSFKTEQLITLWILFFIIIIGNSVVLYLTTKERVRKRKSRMTFFVIQLAITDGLTGIISIMTDIIWRYTGNFMAPDIVCRVVRYLQVVLLYASTYVLVSLSIDRYHAIVHPMKFLQGEKQAKVLIVVAWTLSFLFSIPTLIIFRKIQLPNGETQCWAIWPDDSYWKPYMTTVALLIYFIPLIIISVIYFIVIRTIWAKSKSHSVIISNCTVYDGKLDDIPLQSTHNCTLLHEPPYIYSKNFRSPSTDMLMDTSRPLTTLAPAVLAVLPGLSCSGCWLPLPLSPRTGIAHCRHLETRFFGDLIQSSDIQITHQPLMSERRLAKRVGHYRCHMHAHFVGYLKLVIIWSHTAAIHACVLCILLIQMMYVYF
ncbi:neuropeptide S receptor isoform X1 [Aquarana catesbeiana]|uniref:neuropeptide S receptor isoform X1 n=1 Tax=Aquarana catesbeiana TaxID=8400 RepID=UPI003CC9A8E6